MGKSERLSKLPCLLGIGKENGKEEKKLNACVPFLKTISFKIAKRTKAFPIWLPNYSR